MPRLQLAGRRYFRSGAWHLHGADALPPHDMRCAVSSWDGVWRQLEGACAVSKHGSSACAGILLLAHATHLHLRRLRACLAGTRTACSRLVATCFMPYRRCSGGAKRGCAAAAAAVLHAPIYEVRGYSSQFSIHAAHMGAGGTLRALLGLESACGLRVVSVWFPCQLCHPCIRFSYIPLL